MGAGLPAGWGIATAEGGAGPTVFFLEAGQTASVMGFRTGRAGPPWKAVSGLVSHARIGVTSLVALALNAATGVVALVLLVPLLGSVVLVPVAGLGLAPLAVFRSPTRRLASTRTTSLPSSVLRRPTTTTGGSWRSWCIWRPCPSRDPAGGSQSCSETACRHAPPPHSR